MGAEKEEGKMPKTISISRSDIRDVISASDKSTAERSMDAVVEKVAAPLDVIFSIFDLGKKDDDKIEIKLRD